jgi:hypothetical protein
MNQLACVPTGYGVRPKPHELPQDHTGCCKHAMFAELAFPLVLGKQGKNVAL